MFRDILLTLLNTTMITVVFFDLEDYEKKRWVPIMVLFKVNSIIIDPS